MHTNDIIIVILRFFKHMERARFLLVFLNDTDWKKRERNINTRKKYIWNQNTQKIKYHR